MTQSLTDLFGANVSESASTVTIDLNDYVDSNGNPLLQDAENATPSQKLAAWMSWLHYTQMPKTDNNGITVVDKTDSVVPQTSFSPKTFEVRQEETQVKNEFNFAVYTTDSSAFDPDNVI